MGQRGYLTMKSNYEPFKAVSAWRLFSPKQNIDGRLVPPCQEIAQPDLFSLPGGWVIGRPLLVWGGAGMRTSSHSRLFQMPVDDIQGWWRKRKGRQRSEWSSHRRDPDPFTCAQLKPNEAVLSSPGCRAIGVTITPGTTRERPQQSGHG